MTDILKTQLLTQGVCPYNVLLWQKSAGRALGLNSDDTSVFLKSSDIFNLKRSEQPHKKKDAVRSTFSVGGRIHSLLTGNN